MDRRSIASSLPSESGWRVFTSGDGGGGLVIRVHHVVAWGLVLGQRAVPGPCPYGVPGWFVPLSLSGEILSDKAGYLGIAGPSMTDDEAVASFGVPA